MVDPKEKEEALESVEYHAHSEEADSCYGECKVLAQAPREAEAMVRELEERLAKAEGKEG